jgi:hypothetical protein
VQQTCLSLHEGRRQAWAVPLHEEARGREGQFRLSENSEEKRRQKMPRIRNLFDYSIDDRKPHETLVDVPRTDSVTAITINVEDSGFVQLRKMENEWQVITTLEVFKKPPGDGSSGAARTNQLSANDAPVKAISSFRPRLWPRRE